MPSPNFPFAPGLTIPNTPAAASVGPTDLLWLWQGGQLLRASFSQLSAAIGSQPGGTSGQVQFNNAGSLGGFTVGGDATLNTGTGALTIANNAVSNAKFRQSAALSVVGNGTNALANAADIAGTANQVLVVNSSGTALAFGALNLAAAAAVTGILPSSSGGTGINNGPKTLTFSNSLTFTGTDATSFAFPAASDTLAGLGTAQTFTNQNTFAAGTLTTSQPLTITQTWNAGGITFTGFLVNITNTASAAASLIMDLQLAGSSLFNLSRTGNVTMVVNSQIGTSFGDFNVQAAGNLNLNSNGAFQYQIDTSGRLKPVSDNANDLGVTGSNRMRNGFFAGTVEMGTLRVDQAPTANTSASTTITNGADSSSNLGHRASFNMNGTIFWFPCGQTAF